MSVHRYQTPLTIRLRPSSLIRRLSLGMLLTAYLCIALCGLLLAVKAALVVLLSGYAWLDHRLQRKRRDWRQLRRDREGNWWLRDADNQEWPALTGRGGYCSAYLVVLDFQLEHYPDKGQRQQVVLWIGAWQLNALDGHKDRFRRLALYWRQAASE